MFKFLVKGLLTGMALKVLNDYRRVGVQLLKIEAVACYVHGVRLARQTAAGLVRTGLMIGLMVLGALLFHAGLFIVLPCTLEVKALIAMGLGAVYLLLGAWSLRASLCERAWLQQSGAAAMLADVTRTRDAHQ